MKIIRYLYNFVSCNKNIFLGLNCIAIFWNWVISVAHRQFQIQCCFSTFSFTQYSEVTKYALNQPRIVHNWVKFPKNMSELKQLRNGYVLCIMYIICYIGMPAVGIQCGIQRGGADIIILVLELYEKLIVKLKW